MLRNFPLFLPLPATLGIPLPAPSSPASRTPPAPFSPGLPPPCPAPLDTVFQPLMFVVVTIKDLKYYLQRDELISLLMFVTLGPAYLYNSVAGCCVSHHGV